MSVQWPYFEIRGLGKNQRIEPKQRFDQMNLLILVFGIWRIEIGVSNSLILKQLLGGSFSIRLFVCVQLKYKQPIQTNSYLLNSFVQNNYFNSLVKTATSNYQQNLYMYKLIALAWVILMYLLLINSYIYIYILVVLKICFVLEFSLFVSFIYN